jgi:hypothetical protein
LDYNNNNTGSKNPECRNIIPEECNRLHREESNKTPGL